MPIIPALQMLPHEECKFKGNLDYIVRPCLRKGRKSLEFTGKIAYNMPGTKEAGSCFKPCLSQ